MLGGLAYQDPEHASIKNLDLKNLSQINSEIADTAVDVFVYDTTKDSDGGDWRKRTQNTSWYNETLNTATRGSRKEFPAVAVIVAETTKVTIYDGDDPDMPMWMVFNQGGSYVTSNNLIGTTAGTNSAISSLNGILSLTTGNEALYLIKFISDTSHRITNSADREYLGGIGERNSGKGLSSSNSTNYIINANCNDVVMTVLPNAPIDSATGLPIPTIAVATDGGVSVIKDDGNVVDITSASGGNYHQSKAITITEENYLWWLGDYNAGSTYLRDSYAVSLDNFPSSDFTWNNTTDNLSAGTYYALTTNGEAGEIRIGPGNTWAWNHQERNALGGPSGLAIHKPNIGSETNSLIAAITSDYNTGYMHGSCEGAFLSDTDTTNVTGSEKIANYNFAADFSTQWEAKNFANTSYDATNDRVTVTSPQNYSGIRLKGASLPTLTQGKRYIMTVDIHSITNPIRFGVVSGGTEDSVNSTGSHTLTFTAGASISEVFIEKPSGAISTFVLNSVSIREAEEDRSVNDKGLVVYGTITKTPVATGADLVAYSGFSASNYLQQPYNSDLAPGTAAYSVSCWFKTGTSSGDQYIFDRNGGGSGSRNLLLIMSSGASGNSANKFQWWHRDNTGNVTEIQITDKTITDNVWHQVVALNDGSTYKIYVDGEVSSITSSQIRNVISDNNPPMFVGIRHSLAHAMQGSMALFRYSRSAPTPEQIKKMYEDEKCLFHENAKATLYGSSDAVTALAFDDTTNLLHVGTSAGRSEFQGLCRINNTTDAVTTAISASNGLVAEQ
jgi:hypothetical protein